MEFQQTESLCNVNINTPPTPISTLCIENLSVSACVCCQTRLCGSGLLFCKIPNLISIFASSCFANPAFFCRIYLIWLSACKGVLSNQPGSEWTSKLKPWPRCVVAAAENDFPFTICCREEGGEEKKKTNSRQHREFLLLSRLKELCCSLKSPQHEAFFSDTRWISVECLKVGMQTGTTRMLLFFLYTQQNNACLLKNQSSIYLSKKHNSLMPPLLLLYLTPCNVMWKINWSWRLGNKQCQIC